MADAPTFNAQTCDIITQLVLGPVSSRVRNARQASADRWMEIETILHESTRHDGVAPFSEQFLRGMEEPDLHHWHALVRVDGHVRGIAAVDPSGPAVELAVHPSYRQGGLATVLQRAVRAHASSLGLGDERDIHTNGIGLTWWAHGDLPAARAAAEHIGATADRELLVMELPGSKIKDEPDNNPVAQAAATLPEDVTVLSWTESARRWGKDAVDAAWLAVNNEAFDWHPEQGGWDQARLDQARRALWYDPDGVLLLWGSEGDQKNRAADSLPPLLGFHWTKIAREGDDETGRKVGEVYVIGLARKAQGRGLGRALTAKGIQYLASNDAVYVELYVEADNAPAVHAYEALGFTVVERHTAWKF